MSYHRLTRPHEIEGRLRPQGFIVDHVGPMRPHLEPLDPAEHSRWIEQKRGLAVPSRTAA